MNQNISKHINLLITIASFSLIAGVALALKIDNAEYIDFKPMAQPVCDEEGKMYYDSTDKATYVCNGTIWLGTTVSGNITPATVTTTDGQIWLNDDTGQEGNIYNTNYIYGYNDLRLHSSSSTVNYSSIYLGDGAVGKMIGFYIDGAEKMRVDDTGNIGIATSTPQYTLDVDGSVRIYNNVLTIVGSPADRLLMNNNNIAGVNYIMINDPGLGEGLVFGGLSSGNIDISVVDDATDNKLIIRGPASLQVGIGNTDPQYALDVLGQINASGGLCIGADCITAWSDVGGGVGGSGTAGQVAFFDSASIVTSDAGFVWDNTTKRLSTLGPGTQGILLEPGSNDVNFSDIAFYNGAFRAGRIDASTLSLQTRSGGNVGIGTTAPATPLHVYGGGTKAGIRLEYSSASPYGFLSSQYNLHLTQNAYYGSGGWKSISSTPSMAGGFQTNLGGNEIFRAFVDTNVAAADETLAMNPVFVIKTDGNVGIGTTDPEAKLHVSAGDSSYAIYGPNATYGAKLRVGHWTSSLPSDTAQVGVSSGNIHIDSRPSTSYSIYLNHYSAGNVYMVSGGGKVGIGITNPQAKLDIQGDSGYELRFSGTDGANIYSPNASMYLLTGAGKELHFGTGGTNSRMTIQSDGDVGINDITPSYDLDVNGTGRFTNSLYANNSLYMSDTNVYDANTVQANTLEDPEDSTLYINDWLLVGNALEVGGSDIELGTLDSRNKGSNTGQRAFVHWEQAGFTENPNSNDTLVMNFFGDFEGGVRVHGPGLIVDGNLQIGKRGATVYNWSGGFLSKGYAENTTSDCNDSSDSGRIRIAPYSAGNREAFCVCLREALNEYAWFCLVATDS